MLYDKLTKTFNDAQDFAFMKSSQNIIDINNSVEQTDASILIISWWYNINEKVGSQWNHCVKSVQIQSYFWSVFSCIRTEYGDLRSKSPYSVRIRENTDQK